MLPVFLRRFGLYKVAKDGCVGRNPLCYVWWTLVSITHCSLPNYNGMDTREISLGQCNVPRGSHHHRSRWRFPGDRKNGAMPWTA